jgi:hypothetical protein
MVQDVVTLWMRFSRIVPQTKRINQKRQNEIIKICGEMITEELITKVKEAKFFCVLADEATD